MPNKTVRNPDLLNKRSPTLSETLPVKKEQPSSHGFTVPGDYSETRGLAGTSQARGFPTDSRLFSSNGGIQWLFSNCTE